MAAESKKRKLDHTPSRRTASSSAEKQVKFAPPPRRPATNVVQSRGTDPKIQQEKDCAVPQAQQEKVTFAPPPRRPVTNVVQSRGIDPKIQQAKDCEVAQPQAQQEQVTFAPPPGRPVTNVVQSRGIDPKIQQAKDCAVAQAQQDSCMANFKIFDSPFGNFLVPVIPTRAELSR